MTGVIAVLLGQYCVFMLNIVHLLAEAFAFNKTYWQQHITGSHFSGELHYLF